MSVLVEFNMRGFSLVELLIVIVLISIIIVFMVPSYKTTVSHAEESIMSSQLLRAIHLAQTEAMMRQELITLNKLPGGWQEGYEIRVNEKILHRFLNHKNKGQLHWRAFPVHRDNVVFLRTGTTHSENGTFWYCPKNKAKPSWAIVLNQAGRARVVYPNKWGEIENANPLLC